MQSPTSPWDQPFRQRKDGYGVTLLFIDGFEPEYQTVLDGTYPHSTPNCLCPWEKTPIPVAAAFLEICAFSSWPTRC